MPWKPECAHWRLLAITTTIKSLANNNDREGDRDMRDGKETKQMNIREAKKRDRIPLMFAAFASPLTKWWVVAQRATRAGHPYCLPIGHFVNDDGGGGDDDDLQAFQRIGLSDYSDFLACLYDTSHCRHSRGKSHYHRVCTVIAMMIVGTRTEGRRSLVSRGLGQVSH